MANSNIRDLLVALAGDQSSYMSTIPTDVLRYILLRMFDPMDFSKYLQPKLLYHDVYPNPPMDGQPLVLRDGTILICYLRTKAITLRRVGDRWKEYVNFYKAARKAIFHDCFYIYNIHEHPVEGFWLVVVNNMQCQINRRIPLVNSVGLYVLQCVIRNGLPKIIQCVKLLDSVHFESSFMYGNLLYIAQKYYAPRTVLRPNWIEIDIMFINKVVLYTIDAGGHIRIDVELDIKPDVPAPRQILKSADNYWIMTSLIYPNDQWILKYAADGQPLSATKYAAPIGMLHSWHCSPNGILQCVHQVNNAFKFSVMIGSGHTTTYYEFKKANVGGETDYYESYYWSNVVIVFEPYIMLWLVGSDRRLYLIQ